MGYHFLLQGIVLTQGSILHCRQILYHLNHQEGFGALRIVMISAIGQLNNLHMETEA